MKKFKEYFEDFALRDGTPAKKINSSTINAFFIRNLQDSYNTQNLYFGFWKTEGNITKEEICNYILVSTEPQFQKTREKFRWKDDAQYAKIQTVAAVEAMNLVLYQNLALQQQVLDMKQAGENYTVADYHKVFKNFELVEKGNKNSLAWATIKAELEKL